METQIPDVAITIWHLVFRRCCVQSVWNRKWVQRRYEQDYPVNIVVHLLSAGFSYDVSKYPHDSAPAEILQQARQLSLGSLKIDVMTEPCKEVHTGQSGLIGVELPGMKIEYRWLSVGAINVADAPSCPRVRQQSEVAPSAARKPHP